ncbi:hypothetical protein EVAR_44579_1 [Eumeta japonica]|uniref:Uncharacterized protein n=1 Tax=Eumeta variegata TaxID=151549 RepID=A0A4C1X9S4_EUMVA|nr:hypothetical protein EVAR_44579_1 [Eumeta japonica]
MINFAIELSPLSTAGFKVSPCGEGIKTTTIHAPARECPTLTDQNPDGWLLSVVPIWNFEDFICRGRSAWDAVARDCLWMPQGGHLGIGNHVEV